MASVAACRLHQQSRTVVGTGAAWPPSLWVFLILPLWPFKGNIPSAGAVDAGGGCSGPGRVVSWGRATSCCGAEDSEAFPQPLRVHAALAWRPCVRGELPGARQPVEPALPRRGSSAARGPSAQTAAACLLSAAPRHRSGASSCVQAKQLLPITCSSPFSSPWRLPSVPTPLPTDRRDTVGTDLISRLQGRLVLFGFWRKTSAKENS